MADSKVTFALALPHCSWIPERVESFARLLRELDIHEHEDDCGAWTALEEGMCAREAPTRAGVKSLRIFQDREPNRVWAQKMWRWACDTGATHLLQIQDDVQVAPNFWPALRAMVEAVPDEIIGLEAAHPMGPEIWRKCEHWYRTRAWLIGPIYVFPIQTKLREFLVWCDANPQRVASENEDTLVNRWAAESAGYDIWHPVPTLADHDTSVPSTYKGNELHSHRRPTVTWQVCPGEMLEDPSFWRRPQEPLPTRLVDPYANLCWYCLQENATVASGTTGARIGPRCIGNILGAAMAKVLA